MVRYLRWIYVGWLVVVTAAIVLELYLAGYAAFDANPANAFGGHVLVGDLITLGTFVGVGLALAARVPWRMTGLNALLSVLMVVQFALAHLSLQGLSALHALNGVLILGATIGLTREAVMLATPQRSSGAVGVRASGTPRS
jgi:hypothetical protein